MNVLLNSTWNDGSNDKFEISAEFIDEEPPWAHKLFYYMDETYNAVLDKAESSEPWTLNNIWLTEPPYKVGDLGYLEVEIINFKDAENQSVFGYFYGTIINIELVKEETYDVTIGPPYTFQWGPGFEKVKRTNVSSDISQPRATWVNWCSRQVTFTTTLDNSHLKAGDIAYVEGFVIDWLDNHNNPVYCRYKGTVAGVAAGAGVTFTAGGTWEYGTGPFPNLSKPVTIESDPNTTGKTRSVTISFNHLGPAVQNNPNSLVANCTLTQTSPTGIGYMTIGDNFIVS